MWPSVGATVFARDLALGDNGGKNQRRKSKKNQPGRVQWSSNGGGEANKISLLSFKADGSNGPFTDSTKFINSPTALDNFFH